MVGTGLDLYLWITKCIPVILPRLSFFEATSLRHCMTYDSAHSMLCMRVITPIVIPCTPGASMALVQVLAVQRHTCDFTKMLQVLCSCYWYACWDWLQSCVWRLQLCSLYLLLKMCWSPCVAYLFSRTPTIKNLFIYYYIIHQLA